jgi:hypothetical protein
MTTTAIQLDAIDLHLLARLQIDASLNNQALAELVHVSPPTCLRRVKRLVDDRTDRARDRRAQRRHAGAGDSATD